MLRAPIEKVAKALSKLLKPNRTIVSAVTFKNGTMEEIKEASSSTPYRTLAKEEPEAATSVAAPVRGCPPPDFSQAEIRAQRVLATFLTDEQLDDFRRHQKFISIGQTSGHRYMVTSRHARDQLVTYTRSLYDLELQLPVCAHDHEVPAAEELLGFHVLLQLPGWESYLNEVTDDNHSDLLSRFRADA